MRTLAHIQRVNENHKLIFQLARTDADRETLSQALLTLVNENTAGPCMSTAHAVAILNTYDSDEGKQLFLQTWAPRIITHHTRTRKTTLPNDDTIQLFFVGILVLLGTASTFATILSILIY